MDEEEEQEQEAGQEAGQEVTFEVVDQTQGAQQLPDSFVAVAAAAEAAEAEEVPPTISADPVFQEIVGEDTEKAKRGYSQYDPRRTAIYAHKYRDSTSNWYYYRKGY